MILDTCALLWLAQGGGPLSARTTELINTAPGVYVSAISGFEVGIKWQKGKLKLPASPQDWLQAILEHHDLEVIPLNIDICIRSTELPKIHNDPCDRMIIASALYFTLPVVTHDPVFPEYGVSILR
jgi:PIN domain nuclease of toxin-antitoxin system